MHAKSFVVSGRVQGVGFRAFVERLGSSMGVGGEVYNRFDGSVAGRAEHNSVEVLEQFLAKLQEGPGRVDTVSSAEETPSGYSAFRVSLTRP